MTCNVFGVMLYPAHNFQTVAIDVTACNVCDG